MPRPVALILALVILGAGGPATALANDATPGASATPADRGILPSLAIHAFPPDVEPEVTALGTFGNVIALQPGAAVVMSLGVYDDERCGVGIQCFLPVRIPAIWSVSPDDGARIDPATGELTIDADVPSGSEFTVSAEVEDGRHEVTAEVHVYTPEGNPLVGLWQEQAQLACGDGAEVVPDMPIEELVFAADGQFAVTWQPFESYVDYWGTYAFDLDTGTIELHVTSGNRVPPDIDGQGRFAIDDNGDLVLTDIWLGDPDGATDPPGCGHRLA